ncbi:PKD domain containing lipoprotein precursor. Putative adhesin [Tenacibaculum maritimum]|uniref:PKD domain-containing protein n=1 Tax=Tenacibaculum maritimum TaxID=107401 RepID=UPI0012E5D910|nr:PKD domain-containing protein [Tenacibaculum maritimum]CAA0150745.1 PKD domain containing lipoprotein precursor. Putative adhesin [Tenacibaculum maritimum]
MKNRDTIGVSLFVILMLFIACYQETPIFITANFTTSFVNDDISVPVQVSIRNKTEGADTYQWTFEGATITSSTAKNPESITYEKAGTYPILLKASNIDGEEVVLKKEITVVEGIDIQFSTEIIASNYPPVTVGITNNTIGNQLTYLWKFEGGVPESSTDRTPRNVVFESPGKHRIEVAVSNGFETIVKKQIITVLPDIEIDFDWKVNFFDDDYQAPVGIVLENKTSNAIRYEWSFEKGIPARSTLKNPSVIFQDKGVHNIVLIASNGKKTKKFQKSIEIYDNTNLRVFNDVKLGINTAHNANTIGAFFSTKLRKVFTKNEVTSDNGSEIDLSFLGLNNRFNFNKFVSPMLVGANGFNVIPNAKHTVFVNKQENCNCGVNFTTAQFDAMQNDLPLLGLSIVETSSGVLHFDNAMKPRIVLFQTADGRKGAIKIKEFKNEGDNSYIVCDIKVQKE